MCNAGFGHLAKLSNEQTEAKLKSMKSYLFLHTLVNIKFSLFESPSTIMKLIYKSDIFWISFTVDAYIFIIKLSVSLITYGVICILLFTKMKLTRAPAASWWLFFFFFMFNELAQASFY